LQVKTSDNNAYNHNTKKGFHGAFVSNFNRLKYETKGIYLMA